MAAELTETKAEQWMAVGMGCIHTDSMAELADSLDTGPVDHLEQCN